MIEQHIFSENGIYFPYLLDRSDKFQKRTRVYLYVSERTLTVRVPYLTTDSQALEIIRSKLGWITKKLKAADDTNKERGDSDYVMVFGEKISLAELNGKTENQCQYLSDKFVAFLSGRLQYWQGVTGISHSKVTVRYMKSRWGSCSSEGRLSFNLRLVHYPPKVVDSVIVHELCHIRHHDHSESFWREVDKYFPDYAECRRILLDGRYETGTEIFG